MPVASRDRTWKRRRAASTGSGPRYVLVKGGHLKGDAIDLLWNGRDVHARSSAARIDSTNTHGTGCTFSAAIAAGLARGQALGDAIRDAKAYVTRAIREGFAAGPRRGRSSGTSSRTGDERARGERDPEPRGRRHGKMSFFDHLGELRTRIVWSLIPLGGRPRHRAVLHHAR